MRKLALPEEVLLQIEQPARYIGNEFNSVVKDKEKVALRGAFLFPDVYEIGMSHLGIQILYDMFNKREDMWCERVYSPWPAYRRGPDRHRRRPVYVQPGADRSVLRPVLHRRG